MSASVTSQPAPTSMAEATVPSSVPVGRTSCVRTADHPPPVQGPSMRDLDRLLASARDLHPFIRRLEWSKLQEAIRALREHGTADDRRSAFTRCDRRGASPLHAMVRDAPEGLMLALLDLAPEEERADYLSVTDNSGDTPLHCLCRSAVTEGDVQVLQAMVQTCPAALKVRNFDGDTPLHLFVQSEGYLQCPNVAFVEEARIRMQQLTGPLGLYGAGST